MFNSIYVDQEEEIRMKVFGSFYNKTVISGSFEVWRGFVEENI